MTEQRTTPERRADLRRQMATRRFIIDIRDYDVAALLDDADALAGALAEVERLRQAIRLALDGPSDAEVGMETTRGRLAHIDRMLRAAFAPQSPDALDELLDAGEAATPGFRAAVDDAVARRKRQRAEGASEPAKIAPGCPQDATHPGEARKGTEGPVAGAIGEPDAIWAIYTNWKGETERRRILLPGQLYFGTSPWHETPQWLLEATDADRGLRAFALTGFHAFSTTAEGLERMPDGRAR